MRKHTIPTPYMVGEVHLYTAELGGELVLFDTGPDTPEALDDLRRQIDLEKLRHVFITHCHVDHYGLADFIGKNTRAEIYLPRKDALKFRHHEKRLDHIQELLRSFGFSDGFIRAVRSTVGRKGIFPPFPERYRIVEETDVPQKLGISWLGCPGHSQSDLVYLVGDCAVTGDILLRDIFQAPLLDIDLDTFDSRFRNYDAYCASLLKLEEIRGRRILPGHREEVESLDETILFYVGKLLERAERIKAYAGIESVAGVVRELFGETLADPFVVYIKVSEVVFMRDFLAAPERLRMALERIGLFSMVQEAFAMVTGEMSALMMGGKP